MSGTGFSLTKWYLDCVDDEGRTAIAYWSSLAWRGLSITWHSLEIHEDGHEPLLRTSLEQTAAPQVGTDIEWQAPALGAAVTCRPVAPPFAEVLLEPADRGVSWRCESAVGDAVIACADRLPVSGRGYAERLTLTMPPWEVPIKELRWGRWMSAVSPRSVVWIDWRGPHPLTRVWLDGRPTVTADISETGVSFGGARLGFDRSTVLHTRSLGDTLGRLKGVLAPLMPSSWMALEDTKWRSEGSLQEEPGRATERGWVVHEKVLFP